jgi:hypothetical protein
MMSTLSVTRRPRVVAGALALAGACMAGWGSAGPTIAHAATSHRAPLGTEIVAGVPRHSPLSSNCTDVPGGYRQANIHYYGGTYAGWVQVFLGYCYGGPGYNYARVIVHLRSGSISGSATIYRDPSTKPGALPPDSATSSATVYAGDAGTVQSPYLLSPVNPAHACWSDAGDPGQGICTPSL